MYFATEENEQKGELCLRVLSYPSLWLVTGGVYMNETFHVVRDEQGIRGEYWDTHVALRITSIAKWDVAAHITLFRSKGGGLTQEKRVKIDGLMPTLAEELSVQARHPGVEFTRCEWHGNICQLVLQPSTPFCTALNGARSQVIQLCAIPCKQICFHVTIDAARGRWV